MDYNDIYKGLLGDYYNKASIVQSTAVFCEPKASSHIKAKFSICLERDTIVMNAESINWKSIEINLGDPQLVGTIQIILKALDMFK
jgi:hypothetical protein